ncbi:MAG: hypothetical protein SF097_20410 [Acidobacteriota bacterium]|nr:hypothetical protein [Acidobacteriota bacterium]
MVTAERNLWPQDLFTTVDVQRTPLAILREQAAILGDNARNLIEARVVTTTDYFLTRDFLQTFNLVSPVLSNYTYQLFQVQHPIEGYPLVVSFEDSQKKIDSEDEFIEELKTIFASEKTRRVIQAMIAQSQS